MTMTTIALMSQIASDEPPAKRRRTMVYKACRHSEEEMLVAFAMLSLK
jgi:hypothetical protein